MAKPADQNAGEILEKATRVLTADEKALLDQEWVGKDGSKRKLEVCGLLKIKKSAIR